MDESTLILLLMLSNACFAVMLCLFEYTRHSKWQFTGLACARLAQTLGWGLVLLHRLLPDLVSPVLTSMQGHVILLAGFALEARAQWEKTEHPEWRRFLLVGLALGIGIYCGTYANNAQSGSQFASFLVPAALLLGSGALAWSAPRSSQLQRGLQLASLAWSLGLLIAAWLAFSQQNIVPLGLICLYLLMLTNFAGMLLLVREQQEYELQRLEVVDPLTDVPNRRGFYQALDPWLALARRPGQSTALILFDMDHFKRINDTYGHPVGDLVLKKVVEVAHQQLRTSDMLGRLGGEEFAVLLPRTGIDDAMMVAERMRQAIASAPIKTERAILHMTASMGVTTIRPEDSTVSLFHRADEAMQTAKVDGRNVVRRATPAELVPT